VPAYVIGNIRVTDPATYGDYVPPALATITQYGGMVLAVADTAELLDGGPMPDRISRYSGGASLVPLAGISGGVADPT
jgi:uncharacterized protein (DUF1330 family)